jgi:hypothetical protein
VRRAQKHGVKLLGSHDLMDVALSASQAAPILLGEAVICCLSPACCGGLQPVIVIEGVLQ